MVRGNPSRRRVLQTVGASGVATLTGLAGCVGGGEENDEGTAAGAENVAENAENEDVSQDADAVKIGFLHPHSGPLAQLGEVQEQGAHVAVDHVNEEMDGINGLEVVGVFEDTETDPSTGREKARRLVESENVDVLMGAVSGAVTLSVSDYAHEAGVPYFGYGGPEQLTGAECRPTTFRYQYSASQLARTGAPWALENLGTNVWIHFADYAFGQSIRDQWVEAMEEADADVNIVDVTQTPIGTQDFSSYISEIQASDADWVLQGFSGSDAINFLNQAEQFGLTEEKDIMSTTNTYRPLRQGAGSAVVGTYVTIRYDHNYDSPENEAFVDAYMAEHDQPPTDPGLVMWSSLRLYAKAANNAESTETEDVISELEGLESDEPMGPVTMRECDHQGLRDGFIGQIVEPDEYDWPAQEIIETRPADEITKSCDEVGCEFPEL